MDHKSIIITLGDNDYVARKLGVHPSSVSRWKSYGIPVPYWLTLIRWARTRHIRGITLEAIEEGAPDHVRPRVPQSVA